MTERERPPFPFPLPYDAPAANDGGQGGGSAPQNPQQSGQPWAQEWENGSADNAAGIEGAGEQAGAFDLPFPQRLPLPPVPPFPPAQPSALPYALPPVPPLQLLPEEIAALGDNNPQNPNGGGLYIAEAQAEGLVPVRQIPAHQISEAWEQPPQSNNSSNNNPADNAAPPQNKTERGAGGNAGKSAGGGRRRSRPKAASSPARAPAKAGKAAELLREQKISESNRARIKRNFRKLLRRPDGAGGGSGENVLRAASIIPKKDMHGFALIAVIAIMSFLAAWMLFAAHCIGKSAVAWSAALQRDAVVQIMPAPDRNIDNDLKQAANIARSYSGVLSAHIVSAAETRDLLSPWLGANADISALPVPRLVLLQLDPNAPPDFAGLKADLQRDISGARFDASQAWAARLAKGARIVLIGVLSFLCLVLAAMVMTIIFATRGALAGNTHIIEVLHFIGADDNFIAHIFDRHFFRTGLKGAALGGAAATGVFILLFFWISASRATPEGSELAALFGRLEIDWLAIVEFLALMLGIALLTMATSHWTVMRCLRRIDSRSGSFFSDMD